MKFLIWFLCVLANAVITTIAKENGVILGAIPTVILFSATLWSARTLCKKWDERNENKVSEQSVLIQTEHPTETNTDDKIRFCRKCGYELVKDSDFCSNCGAKIIKEQENDL